jgi:hypothetical protein
LPRINSDNNSLDNCRPDINKSSKTRIP